MLILITRLDIAGNEKPIVVNTDDILSIEPEKDEAYVTTSKSSFPISMDTYKILLSSTVINRLECKAGEYTFTGAPECFPDDYYKEGDK